MQGGTGEKAECTKPALPAWPHTTTTHWNGFNVEKKKGLASQPRLIFSCRDFYNNFNKRCQQPRSSAREPTLLGSEE